MLSRIKIKILQRIAKNPIHGYGLSKEFRISVSSIYKHLNELFQLNFIEIFEIKDSRKIYKITEKGEQVLGLFN